MKTLYVLLLSVLIISCGTIDVFEKNVSIPNHQWNSAFVPEIPFDISDTSALYNIYVVLRHTDAYQYNNIWLNAYVQMPEDTLKKQRLELRLATDDKGWIGSGMDDIFEHRILITHSPQQFNKVGRYIFKLENIMREDPLLHVMNVGIRVEKNK